MSANVIEIFIQPANKIATQDATDIIIFIADQKH